MLFSRPLIVLIKIDWVMHVFKLCPQIARASHRETVKQQTEGIEDQPLAKQWGHVTCVSELRVTLFFELEFRMQLVA